MSKGSSAGRDGGGAERRVRSAAALRENLRRRKAQTQGRAAVSTDSDEKTTIDDTIDPPGRTQRGNTD